MENKKIPDEVKAIYKEVNRIKYNMLVIGGWCVSCCRLPAVLGVRCEKCQSTYIKAQTERNRKNGCMPWQKGKRGRPPKNNND